MVRESGRRASGRRVSYNYKEAFKDLEISGSESDAEQQDAGEVEEPDDFVPAAEEEDPDDFMEDAVEEEEEDDDAEEEEDEGLTARKRKVIQQKGSISTNTLGNMSLPTTPTREKKETKRSRRPGGGRGGTPNGTPAKYVALTNKTTEDAKMRQRSITYWREGSLQLRLKNLFGPTEDDLRPLFQTKDRWISQDTLPSRSKSHLAPSYYAAEEAKAKETRVLREWYSAIGRAAFTQGQKTRPVSKEEVAKYMVNDGPEYLDLMMGGLKSQRIYRMKRGEYMSANTPFAPQDTRRGWTFHLGSRIQDAQWAPNEQGSTQYLAVTVEQKDPASKKYKHMANPKAPAFTKTTPYPASIQIWAFESLSDGSLDASKEPRLAHVICAEWGAPKAIRWWPIGSEDSADQSKDGTAHLGLLASIWSDGKVRILDVSFQQKQETQCVHYTEAALELAFYDPRPDGDTDQEQERTLSTLPSCLCWLSPTTLAVGTASGNVAIWTLTRPGMFPPSSTSHTEKHCPQPWFHKQLADTYIITLASGYRSHPHLLSLTTADGFSRLVDLRSPLADTVLSPRGRMIVTTQAWHEHTQSFVMVDEYYILKHSTLRRYHQAMYTFRADSTLTTVATSPVHPAVLIGTSDGTVAATNPLCRLLNSKESPFSQVWFKHEWRRALDDDIGNPTEATALPTDPARAKGPLTRITEGYVPKQTGIVNGDSIQASNDGAKFITVFEENSMATRVAWNPNLKFGTWAVAGMQSGMLRVEDLGV